MKIAFLTLGCKLNYAETSTYERGFKAAGLQVVPWSQKADIYLVNTCSVTSTSDSKSRNLIRKVHRVNPEARIIVTGCSAELRRSEIEAIDGVSRVFGANEKSLVVPETLAGCTTISGNIARGVRLVCKQDAATAGARHEMLSESDLLRLGDRHLHAAHRAAPVGHCRQDDVVLLVEPVVERIDPGLELLLKFADGIVKGVEMASISGLMMFVTGEDELLELPHDVDLAFH